MKFAAMTLEFFHLCGCNPMDCLHAIYGDAGGPLDWQPTPK